MFPPIGEAWEVIDRKDVSSVVENGEFRGLTIHELIEKFGPDLLGGNGAEFPLIVKLIDAGKRLSLQVHPGENAAELFGEYAHPKTEMWYILETKEKSDIFAGLNAADVSPENLRFGAYTAGMEKMIHRYSSRAGDAFFIPAGTLHAIGAGNLLLEIQQNSDTTFRVTDWGRLDEYGRYRELHVEQALKCMNFQDTRKCLIEKHPNPSECDNRVTELVNCPCFRVSEWELNHPASDDTSLSDSFHILTSVTAPLCILHQSTRTVVKKGRTAVIPASCGKYGIIPQTKNQIVIKTMLSY